MKILLIDNYDSFTYNLYQMLGEMNCKVVVKRNDEITIEQIQELNPDKILISPGPGRPEDSKVSLEAIKKLKNVFPILGVCLGHQAIGIAFGGKVIKAKELMHGKTSMIYHDSKSIFKDVALPFTATRYHSLVIDKQSFPDELIITAQTENEIIMAVRHKNYPVEGIQFHPESYLTTEGFRILKNWVEL
ncbi:MAG: aminodeoxychorismate/anthranilate synthase component II [Ignavibacteriaceae bacterium]|nr:aminodeoxychorismate/anthranilate synthase component II [Ignavibacteriaceae bacterium]